VVAAATAANYGRLQEMPCIPNTSPWMPGKPNFLVKGQSALMDSCICGCAWALGVPIKITDAGQNFMSDGAEAGAGVAEQSASASAPVAAASGFQPMGLQPMSLPNLQTALDGIQLPQIPKIPQIPKPLSFIEKIKKAAETILQKIASLFQSGSDIRSSAAASNNSANLNKLKAEAKSDAKSKGEEMKSHKEITDVTGAKEAFNGQKVIYKAVVFDKYGPVPEECEDVKWAIKIGKDGKIDKDMFGAKRGKALSLEIKEEWLENKEITVMPYFNSPPEKSLKTVLYKLELPKVIIETKRVEGKDENGGIAHDMYFGLKPRDSNTHTHTHTHNFTLEQINGDDAIGVRNAITIDLAHSDDELFDRFKKLVDMTSISAEEPLKIAVLGLVEKMRRLKVTDVNAYRDSLEKHSNGDINNAVFKHEKTKEFRDKVKAYIIEEIKNHSGNISKIGKKIETEYGKNNPKYSSFEDLKNGLKIAINDTWGHRVEIVDYEYNASSKKFKARLKIRIFDHFGLDYGDIEKFGTKQLVSQVFEKESKNFSDNRVMRWLASNGGSLLLSELFAEGFRAWFILQHYRGYRPFVNIMEEEITIEDKL
jgi:hypothetical protein